MDNNHWDRSLRKMLSDSDLRLFLFRLVAEECFVFQESFPLSAAAYSLLAKQEIGKRLLADMKRVNPQAVMEVEQEYIKLLEESQQHLNSMEEN